MKANLNSEAIDWQHALLRMYVDGELNASITMNLMDLAMVGRYDLESGDKPMDGSPCGSDLMGKTSRILLLNLCEFLWIAST